MGCRIFSFYLQPYNGLGVSIDRILLFLFSWSFYRYIFKKISGIENVIKVKKD